ncbi:MAG TPA: YncE family protein, partial [Chitinophagaceae bacterium]
MKRSLFAVLCFFVSIAAMSQHQYAVVKTYHIKSSGGWDYIAVHDGKLYVSHGTQVNVLDESTGDSIGVIEGTTGVHGIAFDDELKKGYTSNGRLNTVSVFDPSTNTVGQQIGTGQNPDAILFEPFTKLIITCNGRSNNLSLIDPAANKTIDSIDVGGKPETAVSNGAGKLYVNIESKNEIAEVDLKSHSVLHHWPLGKGESPTGLAYDPATKRLFAGCEKLLVVMDAESGKVVETVPIDDGCDGVAFDPKTKKI